MIALGPYMTTGEAGHRLGRSHPTIVEWLRSGRLKGVRTPGGRYLIDTESVERERAAEARR